MSEVILLEINPVKYMDILYGKCYKRIYSLTHCAVLETQPSGADFNSQALKPNGFRAGARNPHPRAGFLAQHMSEWLNPIIYIFSKTSIIRFFIEDKGFDFQNLGCCNLFEQQCMVFPIP